MLKTMRYLCGILAFGLAGNAFAFNNNHKYYIESRPTFGNNLYVSQQVQYATTSARSSYNDEVKPAAGVERSISVPTSFSGYALQSNVGVEFFKFLQIGGFYSNVQQGDVKSDLNEISAHEGGAEAKIVLTTPIANVVLGAGVLASRVNFAQGLERASLSGTGFSYGADLNYFVASNVTLSTGVKQVQQTAQDASSQKFLKSVSLTSTRVGVGLSIWL